MDIKRLARAARLPKYMHDTEGGREALAEFARLVAAVEREECAKVCEGQAQEPECTERAQYCADAIRMRSNVAGKRPGRQAWSA